MPTSRLREYLDGTRQRVLWLEYDAYARKVFANDAADWWTQSTRYATTLIQARKALRTDVVSLDLTAPGFALAAPGADALSTCKQALQHPAGHRFITDALGALVHQLANQVDLVLTISVPLDLLQAAGAEIAPGFDELDELTTAILAIVRQCAEQPIAALLLTRAADTPLTIDEQDAYAPLIQAAKHYGWLTCLQGPESVLGADAESSGVDFYLCPDLSPTQLVTLNKTRRKFGGGLPSAAWRQDGTHEENYAEGLWFGTIPAAAKPETVLALCSRLAASP